jgi:hypothetical protein
LIDLNAFSILLHFVAFCCILCSLQSNAEVSNVLGKLDSFILQFSFKELSHRAKNFLYKACASEVAMLGQCHFRGPFSSSMRPWFSMMQDIPGQGGSKVHFLQISQWTMSICLMRHSRTLLASNVRFMITSSCKGWKICFSQVRQDILPQFLRLVVQIEYNLKRGTTDNSYVIQAGGNVALIDVPDQAWTDAFVKELQGKVSLDKITHLILGHFSPKRGDILVKLLKGRSSGGKSFPKYEKQILSDVRAAVRNGAQT